MIPVAELLADMRSDPYYEAHVTHAERLPAGSPQWTDVPEWLHPHVRRMLAGLGRKRLYSHQGQALELVRSGRDVLVTTPTASGKSLCYQLPILDRLIRDPYARAIYMAPTKALARDQLVEFQEMAAALPPGSPFKPRHVAAYDGDVPIAERDELRSRARLIITNPDMLHHSILPWHRQDWGAFLADLAFVAVDEVHYFRGLFGSHVANVLRRLHRLLALAGNRDVRYICASATVANEQDLARRLLDREVAVVSENGAPTAARHCIFCNPPLDQDGVRRETMEATLWFESQLRRERLQTLIFNRSRRGVENTIRWLRTHAIESGIRGHEAARLIRGYRGGYLPKERREIESGLRDGEILTVATTNALELGVDIGQLQCVISSGYAGTVASTRQQWGRAGRRGEEAEALVVFVASADPLDQYMILDPEFLLAGTPEHARLDPDHPTLLRQHLPCVLNEGPLRVRPPRKEQPRRTHAVFAGLQDLEHAQRAFHRNFTWAYCGQPQDLRFGLRNMEGSVDIVLKSGRGRPEVLGTVDFESADTMVHEGAVYWHDGRRYLVRELDYAAKVARVAAARSGSYTTEPVQDVEVAVTRIDEQEPRQGALAGHGELKMTSQVVGYRKIYMDKGGWGASAWDPTDLVPLECPERTLNTRGYWMQVCPETQRRLEAEDAWRDSENDYGPSWESQRLKAIERSGRVCSHCGKAPSPGRPLHVHHRRRFRQFGYVPGRNDNHLKANRLQNLQVLCPACHKLLEPIAGRGLHGMDALGVALGRIAPLHLMCDPGDLSVHDVLAKAGGIKLKPVQDPACFQPHLATLFIHERFEGGLGYGETLFGLHDQLLDKAAQLIKRCDCVTGCPACVGPSAQPVDYAAESTNRKSLARALVDALC